MKGIIYYTDNRLGEPIFSIVQKQLLKIGLPIVSVSLKPIDFGQNIVLNLQPGVITMFRQILTALEASTSDVIFFCEHDVLYHPSHFDFEPPRNNVFYYNVNIWRWMFPEDFAVTYGGTLSTSGLCVNRQLAVNHYNLRLKIIEERGLENYRNPRWARIMGYEPGKKKRQGGISDDICETWRSPYPNVDIRHKGAITKTKRSLSDFRRPPDPGTWKETTLDKIEGWNLKEMFGL
jgi:hypothetical protein